MSRPIASDGGDRRTVTDFAGFEIFRAAAAVRADLTYRLAGQRYPISPVSEGFLILRPESYEEDRALIGAAACWARPVALVNDHLGTGRAAAETVGCRQLTPQPGPGTGVPPVTFAIPPGFLIRRAAATARCRSRAAPDGTVVIDTPQQRIVAAGVGPWLAADAAEVRASLRSVGAIVMSDWTYRNTYPFLGLPPSVDTHVLEYRYVDFDANAIAVDRTLRALQGRGARTAGLLIEGNPDTYDVVSQLPLAGRRMEVVPGTPIGLLAARQISTLFDTDPLASRVAYLSGLHSRHATTSEAFAQELGRYLSMGVTCVLVEMHAGNLELALRVAAQAERPRTVALISDFYSDSARLRLLRHPFPASPVDRADRGALATMLITDAPARAEHPAKLMLDGSGLRAGVLAWGSDE